MSNGGVPLGRAENSATARALQAVGRCYARIYHRLDVRSPCRLPRQGPAILVCNHTGAIDPVLIQSVCPRLIRWMMAKEYFDRKLLRWLFDVVGVILVERSGRDMAATRHAMRALEDGQVLGVFPEGRIETSTQLLPFQSGIGLLALKSGAAVYPAYLDGSQRGKDMIKVFFARNEASIAFGAAVDLSQLDKSRQGMEQAATRIQAAVQNLQNGRWGSPPPANNGLERKKDCRD
jgi:1-acyl-sn-glycerol-3-phosphate acyltransferase